MLRTSVRYLRAVLLVTTVFLPLLFSHAQAVELGAVPSAAKLKDSKGLQRAAEVKERPDDLLVKFRASVTEIEIDSVIRAQGGVVVRKFKRPRHVRQGAPIERWRHIRLPKGRNVQKVFTELLENPSVEHVEPNYQVAVALTPDDPRFPEQWSLNNTGQTGGGLDADIDAPEGWDITTGSADTIVAVIDTGVDQGHPDLAGNYWVNPGEIPGNGIDDDDNGFVDDVYGYDFFNYDGNPADDHGHGTHVAGTIAAAGNNAVGVSGVAWRARIMSVKFLGADGYGWISDAVNAVLYAADNGARIMNNSWGGGGYSQALRDAIAAANDAGILFVAAAGNYSNNNDDVPFYPAVYDVPNVVAVAASDKYDQRTWFTNVGNRTVLLAAPGQDILSTVPPTGASCCSDPSGYKLLSGTSMAAPHVSGAAALLLAQDPARAAFNLKALLHATVDSASAGASTMSGGRLNVSKAVSCDGSVLRIMIETPYHGFIAFTGEPFPIVAMIHACGYGVTGASVNATFTNGDPAVTLYDDGNHGDGAAADGVYGGEWISRNIASQVTLLVSATDAERGTVSLHRSGLVRKRTTYRFEPADFNWVDATGGTTPSLNWYGGATVPLTFGFEFYGQVYNTLFLNRSGYLSVFGPASNYYYPTRLPNPEIPNGIIAPHWSGLNSAPDSRIYVLPGGAAPNRNLTVAWVNLRDSSGAPVTFEVTIHEGSNDIFFQYLQVPDRGAGASVGVEDQNGTEGSQFSAFTPSLDNGTAIRFYPGPFNRAPVANPGGPYTGMPGQQIVFDGTGSTDTESDPLTYRWDFGDGATATGPNPSHAYAAKGTYTVTLTVNDGIHDSAPATTSVTVLNRPPVAALTGDSTGRRNYAVNLNASGSYDPDGDVIETYRWNFGDGSPEYSSYRYPLMYHLYNQLGMFTVTLVVNDKFADSAPVSMTVTIVNVPPIADAGIDYTVAPRTRVILSSSSYDPDGQIVGYQWRQIAGQAVTITDANTSYAYFTAPNAKPGNPLTLEFELTVTDNDGAQASDRKVITVVK